jgi:hypothetical protein
MGNSGSSLQVPAEMPAPLQMVQLLAGFQVSQALYARAKLGAATALLATARAAKAAGMQHAIWSTLPD